MKTTKTPFTIKGYIMDDKTESATWMKNTLLGRLQTETPSFSPLKLRNIQIKIRRKKLYLNATCIGCGDEDLRKDMRYQQYHDGSCERCPEGKCACVKKMQYGWFHDGCLDEICCKFDEPDEDDEE